MIIFRNDTLRDHPTTLLVHKALAGASQQEAEFASTLSSFSANSVQFPVRSTPSVPAAKLNRLCREIAPMSNGKLRIIAQNDAISFQPRPAPPQFDPPASRTASAEEGIQLLRAFAELKDPAQRAWLIRAVERMATTLRSN